MNEEVKKIIYSTFQKLIDEFGITYSELNDDTVVYGTRVGISSLMLVRLIVDLEEAVEIQLQKNIIIADEKILSMNNSPFATLKTMCNFIEELVEEDVTM